MAVLAINPTRNELLKLKTRLKSVTRGHKLLKDKQDGLIQKFLEIVRRAKELRSEAEKKLGDAFTRQVFASSTNFSALTEVALAIPTARTSLSVEERNVMSVRVPEFSISTEGDWKCFGFAHTSGELDAALAKFAEALPLLLEMAGVEKAAENLAWEIETTRRRVNALEHRIIVDLQDTIRFISLKMDEADRAALVSILRLQKK